MRGRLKTWFGNIALLLGALALTLLLLEHVVFRFLLVPDDLLPNVSANTVVRYAPGTRAILRHPNHTETLVTINAQGWNSTKPTYAIEKTPGRLRVAVIGDSYVHGAFVNVAQGFPEVLERRLRRAGVDAEVFRFGMDGAPLSQYLHMLRREVISYKPDIVVVQLVHNDFDESYRFLKTRYASSFLKLAAGADGSVIEIPPADIQFGVAGYFREFRTFRYLYYKTNLYLHAKRWVSRYFWGGDEDWAPEFIQSAVDIRKIRDHDANHFFAHHVLREMQALAQREGFKLAFAMDGVREAIYEGRPVENYEVGRLNRIAGNIARELDLPFLDLQQTFADDYARRGERFEFPFDWHWNAYANALVGRAIARMLLDDPRIRIAEAPRAAALPVTGERRALGNWRCVVSQC